MANALSRDEIRTALYRVQASKEWAQSARMGQFLRFVVERTLAGSGGELKETVIGVEVFGRPPAYDPKADPIVRVEARRLRLKLHEYYAGTGLTDPVRILLPKGRYQPQFERVLPPTAPAHSVGPRKPWLIAALFGGLGMALLLGTWLAGIRMRPGSSISAAPRLLTGSQWVTRSPAFSPDGVWVAYTRDVDAHGANLFLQPSAGGEARPLTSGENFDYEPVWSPDGRSVAFLRQIERNRFAVMVRLVAPDATGERRVAEVALRSPIDWMQNGRAIVAADRDDAASPFALFTIDVADGRKHQVTSPAKGTLGDSQPRLSPDGSALAFVRSAEASVQDVYTVSINGGNPRRLTTENRAVEGLAWNAGEPELIASLERQGQARSLWRVFLSGASPLRIPDAGIGPIFPAVSRRGHRLAYVSRLSDTNLWRAELGPQGAHDIEPISPSTQLDTSPQISPDGQWIAWRSAASGANEVWLARANGKDARQLTHMNGPTTGSGHWSPDGKWIVFDSRPNGNGDIFLVPASGGIPRALTHETSNEVLPSFSRDGRRIYFCTDRHGIWEVWRMDVDGKDRARIAGDGAFAPAESPDGKWLFYTRVGGEAGVWRMPVGGGAEEKLTSELSPNLWGQWAVSSSALYYAVYPPAGTGSAIRRLDLTTHKVRDVVPLRKMPVQFDSGMSVSPDESWIVWSQLDAAGSDIYVVDGFR